MMVAPKNDGWLAAALDWLEPSSIAVSLFFGGMVVTGEAISQAAYYRGLGEQMAESVEKVGGDSSFFREYFERFATGSDEISAVSREREEELFAKMPAWIDRTPEQDMAVERLGRNYIHLKNVTTYVGGITVNAEYWRGRLSEIVGWTVGRAGPGLPAAALQPPPTP